MKISKNGEMNISGKINMEFFIDGKLENWRKQENVVE
jgi:hypothetical protein